MARDDDRPNGGWLLFGLSLVLGVPLLTLSGLTIPGPPSPETIVFTIGALAFVIGGLIAPWRKLGAYTAQLSFLLLFGAVIYRVFAADAGTSIRATTGPGYTEGRMIDRIFPERDVAIGGTGLLTVLGRMPADQLGLREGLRDGYSRMRQREGPVPSPVVGTFLFGQEPTSHTLIRVTPPSRFERPEAVLVFLHGSMGSVTLFCWQIAQAANPVGIDVVCPSVDLDADWAGPEGVQTIQYTLEQLRGQGVRRVYLAGLSAGAVGVSRVAASLEIEGVILISGAAADARPANVPTLVLHGANDQMSTPTTAQAYAEQLGEQARYVAHESAGHWLVITEHEWTAGQIRTWLSEREGIGIVDPAR